MAVHGTGLLDQLEASLADRDSDSESESACSPPPLSALLAEEVDDIHDPSLFDDPQDKSSNASVSRSLPQITAFHESSTDNTGDTFYSHSRENGHSRTTSHELTSDKYSTGSTTRPIGLKLNMPLFSMRDTKKPRGHLTRSSSTLDSPPPPAQKRRIISGRYDGLSPQHSPTLGSKTEDNVRVPFILCGFNNTSFY
ncbi:hypothetical protein BCR43DRAFT_319021 [Syncephalastrum racemosum]|uniref:Uncharacterized protein n=1 Tax=Syncephalastrum racemosum TaxID=13706 RepID=A0A1X2H789_SYNRA|nr:hypothetical protein BCR43DRAFT_319021 [Syncephalastrum racemosum]